MRTTRWTGPKARRAALLALSALSTATLMACGGDDDDTPAATTITGIVASGAPLAGATVIVVDSDPATTDPAPVTAAADGSYTVDVSGLKAPLAVSASGTVQGTPTTMVALVPSLSANSGNTANVTSLTNAVAALVAPNGDPQVLLGAGVLGAFATAQKVGDATSLLVNTLSTDSTIAAALGANYNPLTTPFQANGSGIDGVLDQLAIETSAGGVSITNLAAPVDEAGAPAPVVLTAAQAATPSVVPTLPASAAPSELPGAAEIAALGKKFEDCMALPVSQRVALDSSGTVTAVLPPCNFVPAGWRSDGRTFAEQVGQFTFAKNHLTGMKLGKGQIVLTVAPANFTDPRVHKHPQCNTATCVVVRYPLTTAGGQAAASDWLLAKVDGAWDFVGNHRPYRVFVEPRLTRRIAVNTGGPAPGNAIDPYFLSDRYESVLRLIFDLSVANTAHVRSVRISGPGLPAAGVTLFRSQRCGSSDRLGIGYQNGSTRVFNNTASFQFWQGGATADFVLDAARLDGTALAMPTPVLNSTTAAFQEFSPAAVPNQGTLIPAWSRYTVEVFDFNTLSDEPSEIVYIRANAPAENAALGARKSWPTLAPSFVEAYLKPGGTAAGAVSDLNTTMNWTAPAGQYVLSSYLFSQNFASATNAQGETANHGLRTRLDFEPAAWGDSVGSGVAFADVASGTSLSGFTESSGTNPNPRCTSTAVVPLTDNTSDYREAGLFFRGSDRKAYNTLWFWDN